MRRNKRHENTQISNGLLAEFQGGEKRYNSLFFTLLCHKKQQQKPLCLLVITTWNPSTHTRTAGNSYISSCFSQSSTAELITASAGFLPPNSKHIQIQNTTFKQNQQVNVLLDVVEKGFGNICLCYDGPQQGCCYYNNKAHLQDRKVHYRWYSDRSAS